MKSNEAKDYFLPPVFNNHDELEGEDDDDDENPYLDYDYDKDSNYKDSPDIVTVKTNPHESVDDKIPLHTAKDNLPIFLVEPENTYVVKNKPAVLKCRAANALEVSMEEYGAKFVVISPFFF